MSVRPLSIGGRRNPTGGASRPRRRHADRRRAPVARRVEAPVGGPGAHVAIEPNCVASPDADGARLSDRDR